MLSAAIIGVKVGFFPEGSIRKSAFPNPVLPQPQPGPQLHRNGYGFGDACRIGQADGYLLY